MASAVNNIHVGFVALSTIAAVTGFLTLKYPDRAIFDEPRENVPNQKGVPLLGNLLKISKNKHRFYEYVLEVYEQLNTMTFRSSSFGVPSSISTVDPKNIEHVLKDNFQNYQKSENFRHLFYNLLGHGIFNTDGENWRLQRRTSAQIFHVKNFQTQFTSTFVEHINVMSNHIFDKAIEMHQEVDFHEIMLRFTMDTFVEIAFGAKVNSLLGKVDFAESFDAIQFYDHSCLLFPYHGTVQKVKGLFSLGAKKEKTIEEHIKVLDDFVYGIIKQRRLEQAENPANVLDQGRQTDLLLRFMTTKSASGELYTDKELRDAMLNLVVAGRDTSAQTLSWFLYCVLKHPKVEAKLLEEINEFITDGLEQDFVMLYEKIQKLKYSHAVLNEVLRLYPAVPGNRRQAIKDDTLPDGTPVFAGDEVVFQPFCQGRHERVWGADAKEFKPERWFNADGSLIRAEPGKYVVFHSGPRTCLGQNMAILEILTAMTLLLKKYKFTHVPGHQVIISNQVTLSMKDGMKVCVEIRDQNMGGASMMEKI